jgi:hypothetical protein
MTADRQSRAVSLADVVRFGINLQGEIDSAAI